MKNNLRNILFRLLLVLFFVCSTTGFSQSKTTVLSYNVYNGFQENPAIKTQFVNWVGKIDPDIIAYQEMNKFTQEGLEKFAARYGHTHAVLSKTEGYPVALSSKYSILNVQKITDGMTRSYLHATIRGISVFVVHFSPSFYRKRAEELRRVLAHAKSLPKDRRILIMGDFNALDRKDAIQYGEELLKNMQTRDRKYQQQNLNQGALDYSVMDLMPAAGFQDTFWLVNDQYRYTLPTKKYATRAARRIDYIWANPVLGKDITRARIIHDKDTERMSDHYPVFVEIIQR